MKGECAHTRHRGVRVSVCVACVSVCVLVRACVCAWLCKALCFFSSFIGLLAPLGTGEDHVGLGCGGDRGGGGGGGGGVGGRGGSVGTGMVGRGVRIAHRHLGEAAVSLGSCHPRWSVSQEEMGLNIAQYPPQSELH